MTAYFYIDMKYLKYLGVIFWNILWLCICPWICSLAFHLQPRLLILIAIVNILLFANSRFLIIFYNIKEQLTLFIYLFLADFLKIEV